MRVPSAFLTSGLVRQKAFSSEEGPKQNSDKYLHALFFPWAAWIPQALLGNAFFPLAGIHTGSCRFDSPDNLSCGSSRGALSASPVEGLDRFVSISWEPSLMSPVTQSLATDSRNFLYFTFARELRTLYQLKELKSPQVIRYSPTSFVEFTTCLRMKEHGRNWSTRSMPFMWVLYFLMQVDFTIFSPFCFPFFLSFSFFFPVVKTDVSWMDRWYHSDNPFVLPC